MEMFQLECESSYDRSPCLGRILLVLLPRQVRMNSTHAIEIPILMISSHNSGRVRFLPPNTNTDYPQSLLTIPICAASEECRAVQSGTYISRCNY
jgi:hypothetical protein